VAQWVTGAEILAAVGASPAAAGDAEWADACAAAVNAGIDHRLAGMVAVDPPLPPEAYAEVTYAATIAGAEAYKRREAVYGLTGYVDLEGAAVRVARDYLAGVDPILARYATIGIA
jgi:hypothetical protein